MDPNLDDLTNDWVSAQCVVDATEPDPTAVPGNAAITDMWMMDVMERVDYDDCTQPCVPVAHPDKEPPTGELRTAATDGTTPKERLKAITRIALSHGYACSLAFDVGGQWTCQVCATQQAPGEASFLPSGKASCQECCLAFHRDGSLS